GKKGGRLDGANDPYQLAVDADRSGVAEYLVDEVRNALLLDQVGTGPVGRFLLPGPAVPVSAAAGMGSPL
ncbi:Tat pathway signal sequence domain protein, partial [Streptomyces beijiangensis]|nr:Tat pathway signal sequence domain protein [Streptomyces beijiangensis]